uniref:Cytochrome b n=1 Tax=Alicella gigantea TaxID=1315966 RepID=A0A5B7KZ33_9CRUS|nr:cytochrome b [Alicella gigantea]QAT19466.1 cytochrome b [Alicella gigantea]
MTKQYYKKNPLFSVFNSTLVDLPAPSNLSSMWNFGSLLSMCLIMQIITGLIMASMYTPSMELSFSMITQSMESTEMGWLIRYTHANGASLFFICLYAHTGRGLYYGSFLYKDTWNIGVTILLMTMATAFLGYVLPVNQMSFWGASVITNLFSEVPYIGPNLVHFIWGGVSIHNPTIMRFFTFHFVIPFIILGLVVIHITLLHQTGSNNPLGLKTNIDKAPFHIFLSMKDLLGVLLSSTMFITLALYMPLTLGDNENFTIADPAVTPHHIQPEWYFLFAYAILRSIPNKLGGVLALLLSVLILYVVPFTFMAKMKSTAFYPPNKVLFWLFLTTVALLTWIGMRPVEEPYILTGQILTVCYFSYFIINPLIMKLWDSLQSM